MAENGSVTNIALQKQQKPEEAALPIVLDRLIDIALCWTFKNKSLKAVRFTPLALETLRRLQRQLMSNTISGVSVRIALMANSNPFVRHWRSWATKTKKLILIFKIDCEGCELQTAVTWFNAAAKYNVVIRQILLEVRVF